MSVNESARVYPPHKKFSTGLLQNVMAEFRCTSVQWEELKLRLWDRAGLKTELYELEQKLDAVCSKSIKGKILKELENRLIGKTNESDNDTGIQKYYNIAKKSKSIKELSKVSSDSFEFYDTTDECMVTIFFDKDSKTVCISQDYFDGNSPDIDDISLDGFAKYVEVEKIFESEDNKFISQYKNKSIEQLNKEQEKLEKDIENFNKKTNPNDTETQKNQENTERLSAIKELKGIATEILEEKTENLKFGDTVTFKSRQNNKTFTGKYVKDYKNGWIIIDCGIDGEKTTLPNDCIKIDSIQENQLTLSNLEKYVFDNLDLIHSNARIYGINDILSIDNYVDFASLLGIDSRQIKDIDLQQYLEIVYEIVNENKTLPNESRSDFSGITDEIGSFWVVTTPFKDSIIDDILFKSNILGIANQIRGGLMEHEIIGFYIDKQKAGKIANILLSKSIKESRICWDSLTPESKSYLNNNVEKIGDSFVIDDKDGNSIQATAISKKDKIYTASEQKFNFKLEIINR